MHRIAIYIVTVVAGLVTSATLTYSSGLTHGELRSYTTIHSIGVEWDLTGDQNHNAVCAVHYRKQGLRTWHEALPLFRVSFRKFNMMAGSILFLEPATSYEVRLDLSDPDGGSESRILTLTTRPVPRLPEAGRTFHVVPGSGGGKGVESDPFRGIVAAQSKAQPGDVFLLHAGDYGSEVTFDKPGATGNSIVWKAASDGDVIFNVIHVAASHIWLEGLKIVGSRYGIRTISESYPEDVVIIRNVITECHFCIVTRHGKNWYIADNVIVGDTPPETHSSSGEGVELHKTSGHVVAYNRISNVADGISYPRTNVDIYGNDIFDTSDDGIEPDYGYANIRIWGNRIRNAVHNGITFQPMNSAPWYIIRNQIVNSSEGSLKLRRADRVLLAHNTMVLWNTVLPKAQHLLGFLSRNNLWISMAGGYMWEASSGAMRAASDWRTDLDYDGFDWANFRPVFKWFGGKYPDLTTFSEATGLESHGIRIHKATCFKTLDVSAPPPVSIPAQFLTLEAECKAIDAGAVLPNVNEDFLGNAPDLGAYEYGKALPHYGPRNQEKIFDSMSSGKPVRATRVAQ